MANEMLKKALLASAQEEYFNINKACETELWEPSEQFCVRMDNLVRKSGRRYGITIKKALLVAAVIVLVSVMTLFSFASVRESIINFFKEYYVTHFLVEYGYSEPGDIPLGDGIAKIYTFSSLPEGFEEISVTGDDHSVITIWENEKGDALILSQSDGLTSRNIDAERLQKSSIVIDGTVFEVYTESGYVFILWNTNEYTFSIDYYGEMTADEVAEYAALVTGD